MSEAARSRPVGGQQAEDESRASRVVRQEEQAALRGNTTNGYASTRGDSPSLDDILADGSSRGRDGRNVQQLLRAWQNEMGAPELLKFPTKVVERVVKDLARRVSTA